MAVTTTGKGKPEVFRQVPDWLVRDPILMRAYGITTTIACKPKCLLPVEPLKKTRRTDSDKLAYSRRRRAKLKRAKRCINGWGHGPRTHGPRCEKCHHVHRGSRTKKV